VHSVLGFPLLLAPYSLVVIDPPDLDVLTDVFPDMLFHSALLLALPLNAIRFLPSIIPFLLGL